MNIRRAGAGVAALLGAAGLMGLAACDGGSARQAQSHSAGVDTRSTASYSGPSANTGGGQGGSYGQDREDPRREPVRLVHGKPMWAANRKHSADENAEYQFDRDGADFGAKSVDDFIAKAHAFVDHPPAGASTLVRSNGDKLIYDPKDNVFAVVTKDGAPRTMFKPRNGEAYWEQQKSRAAEGGSDRGDHGRYHARNGGGEDDQG